MTEERELPIVTDAKGDIIGFKCQHSGCGCVTPWIRYSLKTGTWLCDSCFPRLER